MYSRFLVCKRLSPSFIWLFAAWLSVSQFIVAGHFHHDHSGSDREVVTLPGVSSDGLQLLLSKHQYIDKNSPSHAPLHDDGHHCQLCVSGVFWLQHGSLQVSYVPHSALAHIEWYESLDKQINYSELLPRAPPASFSIG